jgi:hypothetical protein
MRMALRHRRGAAAAALTAIALALAVTLTASANPGVDDPTPPTGDALAQQFSVPADGTQVTSMTLVSGVGYKIRASGTVNLGSGLGTNDGDADYVFDDSHTTVLDLACGGSVDIGLGINDTTIDATTSPDWGPLSATHNYTIDFTGAGTALTFQYMDCNYGDNSGSLTVRIFAPPGFTAVGARGLTAKRGARGVTVRWRAASDPTVLGFLVYRESAARRVRLTKHLIPARRAGSAYSYVDRSAPRARPARYWLRLVRADGTRAWYGPARVAG